MDYLEHEHESKQNARARTIDPHSNRLMEETQFRMVHINANTIPGLEVKTSHPVKKTVMVLVHALLNLART